MSYDFRELDAFEKRLEALPSQIDRVGILVTSNSAERMSGEAKRIVRRKSGDLQRSIRVLNKGSFGPDQVGAEYGTDVHYGKFIEKGFRHWRSGRMVGPFPYLRPAYDRFRAQWLQRIGEVAISLIAKGR